MFSFLQSGWFWLFVGSLLLLLAGCILLPKKPEPISPTATAPLISFTVTPFASPDLQLREISPSLEYIFTPTDSRIPRQLSSSPEDDYYAENPHCVPSSNGGYSCLGRVWNNSQTASGSILLNFKLPNGQIQRFSTEQRLIPSQSFAPYRLLIPANAAQNLETTIEAKLPSTDYYALRISDARGQMGANGRYRLTATLLNDVGHRLENIRFFASLVDDEQQIIGYRIYEVGESLEIGERQIIELEIIPQVIPRAIHYELHAEGRGIGE